MIKLGQVEIEQKRFGDNALHLDLNNIPFDTWINWYYEDDSELFTIICLRKHFADREMKLYLPYTPHARMDRVKNPGDVFTLKYFAEIINSLDFAEVRVLDPHSEASKFLINNIIEEDVRPHIQKAIENIDDPDLVLFFPDAGAQNRYSGIVDMSRMAYGVKKRNWETGRIEDYEIHGEARVSGKNVLIVDDICSYGGTFVAAADALHKAGARNVYLYITHCEENIFKGILFDAILGVYTTNSIFNFDKYHGPDGWRVIEV